MPTITVTISNPKYVYTGGVSGKQATDIPVASFMKNHAFDSVSEATLLIRTDVASIYSLETDDTNNALQLNSTIEVKEGTAYHFRGYVFEKPMFKTFQEGTFLEVKCFGWDGILLQSFCVDSSGNNVWTMESDSEVVTDLPLQATANYGSFQGSTLWPDPDDATGLKCYTDGASDELDAGIDDDDETLVLSTTTKGFVPRGWVKIDNEWIYYDGYDNANVDTKYRLYNCKRGELGTTAAAHLATATVQEKLGKQIAPTSCRVENDPAGGYVTLRRKTDYEIHATLGCFVLVKAAVGTYKATYSVYDEDSTLDGGSVPVTLNDVIKAILKGPSANGGPGFEDADLDLDATCDAIKINRYDYDPVTKPIYAFDAIQDLLRTVSLEREVKVWYKHSTGKFRSRVLANDASSFTLPAVSRVERAVSLEDIYSMVRIRYTDDQNINRCQVAYSYHQAATDAGASPTHYYGCADNGDSWGPAFTAQTAYDAAGSGGMAYVLDNQPKSKLGGYFDHDPGGPFTFGDFWFGAGTTPDPIYLDHIKVRIGNYRVIGSWQDEKNADGTWVVRFQGCTDYNSTTYTGTFVDLGFEIESKPDSEGTWIQAEASTFTLRAVNAVRIIFDYMPGVKTSHTHWGYIHDLEVNGSTVKYATCQLTDDAGNVGKPEYLYAPASYEKLRGGIKAASATGGSQRCYEDFIGAASSPSALSIARAKLLTSLRMSGMRRYVYEGVHPGTPELGLTISCDEDGSTTYTGILREYSFSIGEAGVTVTTGTVLNASTDVIE